MAGDWNASGDGGALCEPGVVGGVEIAPLVIVQFALARDPVQLRRSERQMTQIGRDMPGKHLIQHPMAVGLVERPGAREAFQKRGLDLDGGHVGWIAPLARALLVGQGGHPLESFIVSTRPVYM